MISKKIEMAGEHFLDLIDEAAAELDRSKMAKLSAIAFAVKNTDAQALTRAADNYIVFKQRNSHVAAESVIKEMNNYVNKIRDKTFIFNEIIDDNKIRYEAIKGA